MCLRIHSQQILSFPIIHVYRTIGSLQCPPAAYFWLMIFQQVPSPLKLLMCCLSDAVPSDSAYCHKQNTLLTLTIIHLPFVDFLFDDNVI